MIDISQQLTRDDKQRFENLRLETQVLGHLLEERKRFAALLLSQVLAKLGYSPQLYQLDFNASTDKWELKLKPDAIVLPGRGMPKRN